MTIALLLSTRAGRLAAMHHLLWDHGVSGENMTRDEFMQLDLTLALPLWQLHGHETTDTVDEMRQCSARRNHPSAPRVELTGDYLEPKDSVYQGRDKEEPF